MAWLSLTEIVARLVYVFMTWMLAFHGYEMTFRPERHRARIARRLDKHPTQRRLHEWMLRWPNWRQSPGYLLAVRVQGVILLLILCVWICASLRAIMAA